MFLNTSTGGISGCYSEGLCFSNLKVDKQKWRQF